MENVENAKIITFHIHSIHAEAALFLMLGGEMDKYQIIDISDCQSKVDPKKLNADGVILRIGYTGYGSNRPALDTKFEEHYKAYHDAGIPIGIYYFTLAQSNEMVNMETDWVIVQIKNKVIELPIWVDCEGQSHSAGWTNLNDKVRSELMAKWCDNMQANGYYCGIYASKSWFTSKLYKSIVGKYDKWVAQYYDRCTYAEPYGMWQYTSSENAISHGIMSAENKVDASWAYRDYKTLIRDAGLNHLDSKIPGAEGGKIPMSNYTYFEVLDGVAKYSKKRHGDCFFTIDGRASNFQIKEFACRDGSDEILIDGELVRRLQDLRDKFGVTTINSAYRTPAWNAKVGGAPASQHVQGRASDTVCKGTSPLEVAMTAEAWGMGGIGLYSSFTHIDTRSGKARWDNRSGKEVGVSTFFKTIRFGSVGEYVRIAQRKLGIKDDGAFGNQTKKKTIEFQRLHGLVQDGIIGSKTWTELMR